MRKSVERELEILKKAYPHKRGQAYSAEFRSRLIELYRREHLSLSFLSREFGISSGLLCLWNSKYKVADNQTFTPVKVLDDAVSGIELLSPCGYVIKGLSVSDLSMVLKHLHA